MNTAYLMCSPAAIDYRRALPDFFRRFHNLLPATILGQPISWINRPIRDTSASVKTTPAGNLTPIPRFPAILRTVSRWQPSRLAAVVVEYSTGLLLPLAAWRATA